MHIDPGTAPGGASWLRSALASALLAGSALAGDFYVDGASGSDANAGSLAAPWKTINFACNNKAVVTPGSTISIRGGVYHELVTVTVSGSAAGGFVSIRSFPGETAILDGTGLTIVSSADNALLFLDKGGTIDDVVIQGLEIRNYQGAATDGLVAGILFQGSGSHVEIRDCHVHDIKNTTTSFANRNAHGIGLYGTSGTKALADVVLDGNTVDHCTLGNSEAVVLNGNVDGFTVTHNLVQDNDNIGIDLIGFEGTAPANDQARHGEVSDNTAFNCSTFGNPSYNEYSCAGIYVDGGLDIVIERNLCHHDDIGIEVGCEHAGKTTSTITVRDNFVYRNNMTGLAFGGYATGVGTTANSEFTGNTCFQDDSQNTGTGELLIQKAHDNAVRGNVFVATGQNLLLTNPFGAAASFNNTLDFNAWFEPDGNAAHSQWVWKNASKSGYAAYKAASGQDADSIFADPLLADAANGDLHLLAASPCIDAGDPAVSDPSGALLDFDGDSRILAGRIDIGADEATYLVAHWSDLGGGLGQGAPPRLEAWGTLAAGSATTLSLSAATPLAPAFLVVGLSPLGAPFKGGTLVPSPDLLLGPFVLSASGTLTLAAPWPAGLPSGFQVLFQCWIHDQVLAGGYSASNGESANVP